MVRWRRRYGYGLIFVIQNTEDVQFQFLFEPAVRNGEASSGWGDALAARPSLCLGGHWSRA
jgi:hypothetical protein